MSETEQARKKQAGMQTSAAGAQGQAGGPSTVPSEEVGRGPGLDPPSPPEGEDDDAGDDEAFADRPTRQKEPPAATDTDGAAVQRPPADS